MLDAHVGDLQIAPFDHGLIVGPDLGEVCVDQPIHLPIDGILLKNKQHMDVLDEGLVHCGVPRLSHAARRRRQRLPVILNIWYNLLLFAEHHAVSPIFDTTLL